MVNIPKNKALMFVPANEKIFEPAEDDTDIHICSIATKVPPNCVAIIINARKVGGADSIMIYPNEGAAYIRMLNDYDNALIAISNQRIKFAQETANSDWDFYMFGYFVEGPVGE